MVGRAARHLIQSATKEARRRAMKITVDSVINASLDSIWQAWNNPDDIKQWNNDSDDWHTTRSTVDRREGGKLAALTLARDGSAGIDFDGTDSELLELSFSDDFLDV